MSNREISGDFDVEGSKDKGIGMMNRIIIFANRKGGCGKSTTAVNIAHGLVKLKQKVLLIDIDPQAHTTITLGLSPWSVSKSIFDVLQNNAATENTITATHIDGLYLLPSSRDLGRFELDCRGEEKCEMIFAERIRSLDGKFDFIIIDPPPTLGLLMIAALIASREVYIPMPLHFLAMEGLAEMMQIIYKINAAFNPALRLAGIIPTFHNKHTRIAREIAKEIIANFGNDKVFPAVRNNVSLAEAPAYGKTIFEYAPRSIGAEDYSLLSNYIFQHRG